LGGLTVLAVAGVWLAWQADRMNPIEPVAPLPIQVPTSTLIGSMATLTASEPGQDARMAAPTPEPNSGWADPEPSLTLGAD
jgi:hypothetical protein